MRRRTGVSVVVGVILSTVLVAVGPAASLTATQLRAEALSLAQMPKGWTSHHPASDPRLGCLAGLLEPKNVKESHYVEVYFSGHDDLPLVVETLTTYANATSAFATIATRIASCHQLSGVLDGYRVTGTVRPVTMPHYGNASVAYTISVTGHHATVRSDYVIARKGAVVVAVLESAYPSVSAVQFRGFVSAALAKIR